MWVNYLALMNQAILNNRMLFKIAYNTKNLMLTRFLYTQHLVSHYKCIYINNKLHLYVILVYSEGECIIKHLSIMTTVSKKVSWSLKQLQKILLLQSYNTLYLLSTNKGLMTHIQAINSSCSGIMLCKIN